MFHVAFSEKNYKIIIAMNSHVQHLTRSSQSAVLTGLSLALPSAVRSRLRTYTPDIIEEVFDCDNQSRSWNIILFSRRTSHV